MNKKYCDFMDEIDANELYEGLLAYGFFSDKIPPIFTSVPFYEYCKSATTRFAPGWNEYIVFRTMRNNGIPRLMGLPTPMKYERLCATLRDSWEDIKNHFHHQTDYQDYRISRIHIRKEHEKKQLFKMNYKDWRIDGNPEIDLLIHDKGTSRLVVKADISTCFPSIYTHSIPWALVGKEEVKNTIRKDTWYKNIDTACSDLRNGETHGLLVGPHASNLLSEIILTAIDKNLYNKGYRFFRNIDDYDCYVSSYEEAYKFLSDLEKALSQYDLLLNHKKTSIKELPLGLEKNWKHQISILPTLGPSGNVEYPQVNSYIDTSLTLAKETGDLAIINYAIKKLKGMVISENGKKLAAKRFMHMAALYPYLLNLMEDYVFEPYSVDVNQIKNLSDNVYSSAAMINDYESMYYALYFAIKYNFALDAIEEDYKKEQQYVIDSRDCILLVFTWIYFMKKNHWNRSASQVKPLNRVAMELKNKDKEMDRYWLFCYEALTSGSLAGEWRSMKQAGVSFIKNDIVCATI